MRDTPSLAIRLMLSAWDEILTGYSGKEIALALDVSA